MNKRTKELEDILQVLTFQIEDLEKWSAYNYDLISEEVAEIKHQIELINDSMWKLKV